MNNKEYNAYVSHQQELVDEHKKRNLPIRKIEHYPIYVMYGGDNCIYFRFESNLKYFRADEGMTPKDIARELVKDIPYIKSVQFYDEISYRAGIVI
jgi:hypothetical protein